VCLNILIWVNSPTTWHNIYQNHLFWIPKSVAVTFLLKG
jgi:hypothetical protein